ncbi:protein of unknown function (DUF4397) [Candidatus Kryptonium thompsonii]|uniref:DUF4397 domain-containing protein n=3 Tax=Candidatus Kryptonium thompsonii TaxID=1633631 RepID=A0A0P1LGU0_9BACT|nr:DUF4397 domain-containing protein [Candidatus Kryptonium thompsoni]CUS77428.1 protein of unknown function (DUF4397) [Candidatus Kryptonium thompsoni]CUS79963.1 protein of unknown function (DUF4397) [Candidatus Kryptonium thompsoni]CUS80797.1 protein of unknown function (DUF4397) [Candidatus Kryptonium thompsoni]CUS82137.1 protein of unknown function (DUF4397) [Candidatus Kryptonium thompsoni]CUS98004.1 protein of unknown function (DUF4397) [Candidatus Kryptonium thompsoni]
MQSKFTIFAVFFLVFFIIVITGDGCINIDNPVVQPVDYRSLAKFVNLKPDVTIKVNVDGSDKVSSIAFGDASNYLDLPAGSRVFVFTAGDTIKRSLESEKKYSVFYVGRGSDSVLFAAERNTFDEPYPSGKALVRFLNLSPNLGAAKVIVNFAGKDSTFSNVAFKGGTPYLTIASFPVKYTVISGTDTLVKAWDSGISGAGRYSVVVYGLKANLQKKLFKED